MLNDSNFLTRSFFMGLNDKYMLHTVFLETLMCLIKIVQTQLPIENWNYIKNVQKCVIFYAFFIFKKKDDFFQCFFKRGVRNNDTQNQTVTIACF